MSNQMLTQYGEMYQRVWQHSKNAIAEKILSAMGTPAVKEERIYKKIDALLGKQEEEERIKEGFNLVVNQLRSHPQGELCLQELRHAAKQFERIYKRSLGQFENFARLASKIDDQPGQAAAFSPPPRSDAPSLAAILGISAASLSVFYAIGANLFKDKQYKEATSVFHFLSFLNSYTYEIWLSLAMSAQKIEDWHIAIHAYSMATILKPMQALPHLRAAECFSALCDWVNAKDSLESAKALMTEEEKTRFQAQVADLEKII